MNFWMSYIKTEFVIRSMVGLPLLGQSFVK